jgi:serine protease Do
LAPFTLALLIALVWLAPAPSAAETPAESSAIARLNDLAQAFRQVARTAQAGVVRIRVSTPDFEAEIERLKEEMPAVPEEFLRRMLRRDSGAGSGVILDQQGHILTNNHVIEGRSNIAVSLADDREFEATVVGRDPETDLAVLKIDAPNLQPLTLGNSDAMQVGDWVLAVGAPFGMDFSVTHGIVSAVGRTRVPGVGILYQNFIQTDAAINPGNSGGPLLNLRGEVIGINTAIATRGEAHNAGVAFTIPANMAARVSRQLIERGEIQRGWLGISMEDVRPGDEAVYGLDDPTGIIVNRVILGTPADASDLEVDDVIVAMNDAAISDMDEFRQAIAEAGPGEKIKLRVVRAGRPDTLFITLSEQPENVARRSFDARGSVWMDELGVSVKAIRPHVALQRGEPTFRGLAITSREDTPETEHLAGFSSIVAIDGEPVSHPATLQRALQDAQGRAVELTLKQADGTEKTVRIR